MARLRCPRCASVVEAAAGAAPVCTSCGFGSKVASPAAAPPPVVAPSASPTPVAAAPVAAAPGSRRGAILAICIVGFLVLAGAAAAVAYFALRGEEPGAITEAEARTRVEASLQAAGDALSGESRDDDLRKVTIRTESAGTPSGPEDLFGGMGDMTATIQYGKGDRVRFDLHMASGAVTVAFSMICTPERQYMIAGGETYASRPAVVPLEDGESACQEFDEGGFNESMPLDGFSAEDAVLTRNDDGSVHAVLDDPEEGRFEMDIDAKGRVRSLTAEPPASEDMDMTMTMTFDYGERATIDTPDQFQLLPASVEFDQDWDNAEQTWTVSESREEPPLADFEVRVQDYSFDFESGGSDADSTRAVFELRHDELQTQGELTFRFTDADDDGKLSAGDSFVLTDLAEDASGMESAPPEDPCNEDGYCDYGDYEYDYDFGYSSLEVVVYDRVADGAVNSGFSEMPVPTWLAFAALAFAGLLARRSR